MAGRRTATPTSIAEAFGLEATNALLRHADNQETRADLLRQLGIIDGENEELTTKAPRFIPPKGRVFVHSLGRTGLVTLGEPLLPNDRLVRWQPAQERVIAPGMLFVGTEIDPDPTGVPGHDSSAVDNCPAGRIRIDGFSPPNWGGPLYQLLIPKAFLSSVAIEPLNALETSRMWLPSMNAPDPAIA